ncbi:helix-turn-helix transcriptional regulator [Terrisporobacter petrolearius]|uniref:helix-turn-helix transcriptional regulator n=1 Tax=Terrisporobacter TaxID=1505652 RepID=UPI001D16B8AA|nr:helix-turn-helix transcriptional regulator [Terrisporobacter petrolearius]MCC3866249.1 helix-turn-helix transcriptional regulator [Terrisporobacter petrolearius]
MKNKLKQFREELGLTQEQLGKLVGVSRQAINSIETEKFEPSIWLAYDIARIFHSTIEKIFIFEESERKSRSEQSRGVI